MQYGVQSYRDFLTVVRALRETRVVFYWDNIAIGNRMFIHSVHADGRDVFLDLTGITTPPTTFHTDFPGAVQILDGGF